MVWNNIGSLHTHAAKPICLHLPTILSVNKVVRPYDIVMNKVKVLDDPLNPLLKTSLDQFAIHNLICCKDVYLFDQRTYQYY